MTPPRRSPTLTLVVGLALLAPACLEHRRPEERHVMNEQQRIPDEAAAIEAAKHLTGLGDLARRISAQRVAVATDDTPFLAPQIIGRQAWSVVFEGVSLKLRSSIPGYPDRYRRRFVALLDEDTGRLLGVSNKPEAPDMVPPPRGASAEAQIRGSGEVYQGWPEVEPKLTFLDALDAVLSKGGGSPFLARAIDGLYVMHSRLGSAPRPVWIVTLWGLPPMAVGGPGGDAVPVWQRDHMRNVLDAMTGQVLFATTVPQPDGPAP
jgi:hypothetical protein